MGTRRDFLQVAAAAAAGAALPRTAGAETPMTAARGAAPVIVSTHAFGQAANEEALARLRRGQSALDALEAGICVTEADADNASVGLGGRPNADGVVQLDACIMSHDYQAGSVAALEGIAHPISVARRVMEASKHVMLVGAGARQFALAQGFATAELLTDDSREAWEKWRRTQEGETGHDTIAQLLLDEDGVLVGGCSTSGWGYKHPGRVGDSPILGSGLYVDGNVGAAGATGLGEDIMRHGACLLVVEAMAAGLSPQEACQTTVQRIVRRDPGGLGLDMSLIALDLQGRSGGATTRRGFRLAVTGATGSRIVDAVAIESLDG